MIEPFNGNQAAPDRLLMQEHIYIAAAFLGRTLPGAYRSANSEKHLSSIRNILQQIDVLSADAATAEHYALLKASLYKKGTPIPENDIWIAATTLQYQLPPYTFDKHFDNMDDLPQNQ